MAKKNSGFKFSFNAPFTLIFSLICIVIFLLDYFVFKGSLSQKYLICNSAKGDSPFNFTSATDYFTLLTHVFAETSFTGLFINIMFLNILSPSLEEKYGGPILLLMAVLSTLISGVLTACIGFAPLTGYKSIILMMIFLSSLTAFQKKDIQVTWVLVIISFILIDIMEGFSSALLISKLLTTLINLIAGIAGSLFGFLAVPKKTAGKTKKTKASSNTTIIDDNPIHSSPSEII